MKVRTIYTLVLIRDVLANFLGTVFCFDFSPCNTLNTQEEN